MKITVKDKLENDTLDLSFYDLEDVPVKEIAAVKKGIHLDLSNNQLVRLPSTFVSLTHIVKLDLSKNLLEELPENIGQLRQLKHLDLYSNKISRLPLSFGELKNLRWLDLKDNPLNPVLSILAGPCGNNQECQKCANCVIYYYTDVIKSIEKKKQLAMETPVKEEQKKKSKRSKKKKNPGKGSINSTEQEKVVVRDSETDAIIENPCREVAHEDPPIGQLGPIIVKKLLSLLSWSLLLYFVYVLVITLIPELDPERSRQVVKSMEAHTGLPIRDYQRKATKKLHIFIVYAKFLFKNIKVLIGDTYLRHFGEEPVDVDDADL